MPRETRTRTGSVPAPPADSPPTPPPAPSDAQLDCWADLIADGRDGWPDDLPPHRRGRLEAEVRLRLRGRLVHLIARAIAARLRRGGRPESETEPDARPQV
jgi:hypothetical protein